MRREESGRRFRVWLVLVVVSLGVMGVDGLGWLDGGTLVLEKRVSVVERWGYKLGQDVSEPARALSFYRSGVKRLADLEARLAERLVDYEYVKELEVENERMRKLLGAPLPPEWKFLPVRVLGVSGGEVLVEGGSAAGVVEGMSVVVDEVLVGVVKRVSLGVSEVGLLGVGEDGVAGRVSGSGARGVIERSEDGSLVLSEVLQEVEVGIGEVVVSAGSDGVLPGLVVGVVEEVEGRASGVHKVLRIRPAVSERELDVVFVVLEGEAG